MASGCASLAPSRRCIRMARVRTRTANGGRGRPGRISSWGYGPGAGRRWGMSPRSPAPSAPPRCSPALSLRGSRHTRWLPPPPCAAPSHRHCPTAPTLPVREKGGQAGRPIRCSSICGPIPRGWCPRLHGGWHRARSIWLLWCCRHNPWHGQGAWADAGRQGSGWASSGQARGWPVSGPCRPAPLSRTWHPRQCRRRDVSAGWSMSCQRPHCGNARSLCRHIRGYGSRCRASWPSIRAICRRAARPRNRRRLRRGVSRLCTPRCRVLSGSSQRRRRRSLLRRAILLFFSLRVLWKRTANRVPGDIAGFAVRCMGVLMG